MRYRLTNPADLIPVFDWRHVFSPALGEIFQRQPVRRLVFFLIGYCEPIDGASLETVLQRCRQNINPMACARATVELKRAGYIRLHDGKVLLTKKGRRKYAKQIARLMQEAEPND